MTTKKLSVNQLFWEQVGLNFIVVAILIAMGALLTFKVMGEEYSQWTVVGFFATVLFAFIVFLPEDVLPHDDRIGDDEDERNERCNHRRRHPSAPVNEHIGDGCADCGEGDAQRRGLEQRIRDRRDRAGLLVVANLNLVLGEFCPRREQRSGRTDAEIDLLTDLFHWFSTQTLESRRGEQAFAVCVNGRPRRPGKEPLRRIPNCARYPICGP